MAAVYAAELGKLTAGDDHAQTMNALAPITITPILVADLHVEGERMPPGVKYVPVDGELEDPRTEGQLLVRAQGPELVWLSHEHEPWRPPRP